MGEERRSGPAAAGAGGGAGGATPGQGEGARLREGPAPELRQAAFRLELADAPILHRGLGLADLAHVIVLAEAGVVPAAEAARLLGLLLELHAVPEDALELDDALEDVWSNREAWLGRRDEAAAGWLGAGRPRREPATIAYRVAVRERLLTLAGALCAFGRALADQAAAHVRTLTPDYTYLQPATPTSLAHYLLSFAYPVLRDLDRLEACFARTNQFPGGIGNVNGSRLPLDRRRLAGLLGFDGVVANTRDAMWQVDQPVEVVSVIVTALLHLDRLAEDLQIWNTAEFGLVELADRHARVSLIMPQKKNPYSLAFVRGAAASLTGRLTSMAAVGRSPSGQVDNRIFALGEVPRALDRAIDTVRLMAGVVGGLRFAVERMRERARAGFTHATDLAETIMLEAGVSYRQAHRVVGLAVRLSLERDPTAGEIPPAVLDEAATAVLGRRLGIAPETLSALADPADLVSTRTGLGGAAAAPVEAMIDECRQGFERVDGWRRSAGSRLEAAESSLVRLAGERAAAGSGGP